MFSINKLAKEAPEKAIDKKQKITANIAHKIIIILLSFLSDR